MRIISAVLKCNLHKRSCVVIIAACRAWLLLVPACFGEPGIFVQTGDLNTARFSHTATLLPNGKVLVVGGVGTGGVELGSAELYDPATGMWMLTGSLMDPRDSHVATLLPDGKVLVAGGYGQAGPLVSAELYDPSSGLWSTTGHLGISRYFFSGALLPNGKVLVAGGSNGSGAQASAELYDPAAGTWMLTGAMTNARDSFSLTLLMDGRVLVAGGTGPTGASARGAELYDPASGLWTPTGNLVTQHYANTATLLEDGKVLEAGSNACCIGDAELYDPVSGMWQPTGNLVTRRVQHTATLLESGDVLVVAGNEDGFFLAGGELYDPLSATWMATANMLPPSRALHTATILPNGQVLVAGGNAGLDLIWSSSQLYISGSSQPVRLLNLSTRGNVLTGDEVVIGGFIINGSDPKTILIRGLGPSLIGLIVGGVLIDPTLELHQGNTLVATNDDWKTRPDGTSQQAEIEATTIPPTNDQESAILVTVAPGGYTVSLAGKIGGTGIGLVEIYDVGQSAGSKLANLSTRGSVGTGDTVMIGGFIVDGGSVSTAARVLLRALGPSIDVANALADPTLELRDPSGALIASNDNWKLRPDGSSQQAEIEATGLAPSNDLESALVQSLFPGDYTAIVFGKNNAVGIGLVEIYKLQ